jgi:hypothetical protein
MFAFFIIDSLQPNKIFYKIMKKMVVSPLLLLAFLIITGCAGKEPEEVVSKHPDGAKKETAIFTGEKQDRVKLKSFEYYETGEKKRAYHHRDNEYFGTWTYWYRDGSLMAMGFFDEKTGEPGKGGHGFFRRKDRRTGEGDRECSLFLASRGEDAEVIRDKESSQKKGV